MRLVDADELMEHVWRDKLDSRELIAQMIENAPTIKEISTKIPIDIFKKLVSQEPKTGHWINKTYTSGCGVTFVESECTCCGKKTPFNCDELLYRYCPNCGAKMEVEDA